MKVTWNDIVRKLTSRKLWVAIAGIGAGIAMALGVEASEIESIAGVILAMFSIGGYIAGEAYVDGKHKPVEIVDIEFPEGSE